MKCTKCNKATAVLESRTDGQQVNRRRECKSCGHRFKTAETVMADAPKRVPKQAAKKPAPVKNVRHEPPRRARISDERDLWHDAIDDNFTLKELGLE